MVGPITQTQQSPGPGDDAFRQLVDEHQRALRVHCYRMLGSLQDAEDQTQETLLRAWRNLQTFQGRASVRAWLYRIATNACLDELDRRGRRLLPPMLGSPSQAFAPSGLIDETPGRRRLLRPRAWGRARGAAGRGAFPRRGAGFPRFRPRARAALRDPRVHRACVRRCATAP